MSTNEKDNFMNGRTILAIVLTAGLLFGWQRYMSQRYGNRVTKTTEPVTAGPLTSATTNSATATNPNAAINGVSNASGDSALLKLPLATQKDEKFTTFENENWKFEISSIGMKLRNIVLKNYKNRDLNPVVLAQQRFELFETTVGETSDPVYFEVKQTSPNEYVGEATVGAAHITKTILVDSAHYSLKTTVAVAGGPEDVRSLNVLLPELIMDTSGATFYRPAIDRQSLYVAHGDATDRDVINSAKPVEDRKLGLVSVVSAGGLYFASALVDESNVRPDLKTHYSVQDHRLLATLNYPRLDQKQGFKVDYTSFAGPKSLELLKEVDPKLSEIVDFGMFGLIARPMLWLMKLFYSFAGNYGLAIILLTLLVRLIVLPFNVMSFRSMKTMAALQPRMKSLREKYAKDAPRMNMEIATLLKENKANPLGGCLPMLLQMPVFFALYRVLGNSIELYQAPFALWIQDLSLKDPFYVLPVLMGISMFIQQKLTPNTMDAAQAKMMAFMPLIFAGMMVTLPSGLTLYIFVSTLFGITQQKILMGDRKVNSQVITIKT